MTSLNMTSRLLNAMTELYDWDAQDYLAAADFRQLHSIKQGGSFSIRPIVLLPKNRFDFPNPGDQTVQGCIVEVLDRDGETPIDLAAWPVDKPTDIRTLCGSGSMLGMWEAYNPATYYMGGTLQIHRDPLDWLRTWGHGAAVLIPHLAARNFLEIADTGGLIAACSRDHARVLDGYLHDMIGRVQIVYPAELRRAA